MHGNLIRGRRRLYTCASRQEKRRRDPWPRRAVQERCSEFGERLAPGRCLVLGQRVELGSQLVDVHRISGTDLFDAVLVEQDDEEVAGLNMEAAARICLVAGRGKRQVLAAEM